MQKDKINHIHVMDVESWENLKELPNNYYIHYPPHTWNKYFLKRWHVDNKLNKLIEEFRERFFEFV